MPQLLNDYLPLVIFIGVAGLIGVALLVAPFIVAYSRPDTEKGSAYECGCNAVDDARKVMKLRFILPGLSFLLLALFSTHFARQPVPVGNAENAVEKGE